MKVVVATIAKGFSQANCGYDEGTVEDMGECESVLEGDTLIMEAAVTVIREVFLTRTTSWAGGVVLFNESDGLMIFVVRFS